MILSWMVYGSLVTLLFGVAARLLEPVTRQRGWPVRGVWVAALVGSLSLPILLALRPAPLVPDPAPVPVPAAAAPAPARVQPAPAAWLAVTEPLASFAPPPLSERFDGWLVAAWAALSAAVALGFTASYGALLRRRRGWVEREVDGRMVWVSTTVGPAVVGFLPGRIVLPRWLLGAGAEERAMALAHEEEHLRAGDARLLLAAFLVGVALPWNPGLWWICRSLRRAVEIDCDLRVLARGVDPRAYGRLLVEVMERGAPRRLALVSLSESPSFLERRVRLMLAPRSRFWSPRAAGALLLASGCVFAACQVEQPSAPVPATGATYSVQADGSLARAPEPAATPAVSAPVAEVAAVTVPASADPPELDAIVRTAVERYFPNLLTEKLAAERVVLYLLADSRGEMIRTAVDTEARNGECMGILMARLGLTDRKQISGGGCGGFDAGKIGPNKLSVFFGVQGGSDDSAVAPPTGPFLFMAAAGRGRPTEQRLRAAVQRYYPDALQAGVPYGQAVWFVADADGQVLHTGRGLQYASSPSAREDIEAKLPGVRLGAMTMSSVKAANGERVDLVWARVAEPGSPAAAATPFGRIRSYIVTSPSPGQEVTIQLQGEAAADPNAFRVAGAFTREGTLLRATTPFTFMVVSGAQFSAALDTRAGPVEIATQAEGRESRFKASSVQFRRDAPGGAIIGIPGD